MFCDKNHINRLTSLLAAHQVADAVVCPGSRNGVIVHNLYEVPAIRVHPVTDERSAGFVALGIAQATRMPVAVCVTSGSALLNLLPAVAEASYRHIPLVVISADRPADLIGQLDGQTLRQQGALDPYAPTYVVPEVSDEEGRRYADRQVNEALLLAHRGRCVHLNVPVKEPLFSFRTETLPECRRICEISPDQLVEKIRHSRLPLLVCGQMDGLSRQLAARLARNSGILLLPELIANIGYSGRTAFIESSGWPECAERPDLVVHIGGNLVHKRLKQFLRRQEKLEVVRVSLLDEMPDTFFHLQAVCRCDENSLLEKLTTLEENTTVRQTAALLTKSPVAQTNEELAVAALGQVLESLPQGSLHLANSSAVRLAARFLCDIGWPVLCNRGVNGIEGSLSTAVGHALATPGRLVVCLIGDLSFFYDQNALWNTRLPDNLRIVLLNNGGGRIFDRLPGLSDSPALTPCIKASHHTSARGICDAYGVDYLAATQPGQYADVLRGLFSPTHRRTTLAEILIP